MMDPQRRAEGDDNCGACVFWAPNNFFRAGECRRHAPERTVHRDMPTVRQEDGAAWPQTSDYQWCGDFVRAEPSVTEEPRLPRFPEDAAP